MGKEGDLWDDSALINAFDDAISKYKIMHDKGVHDGSPKGGKIISSPVSAIVDGTYEAKRHMEADDNSHAASKYTAETGETINPSPIKENISAHFCAPDHHISSANCQNVQDVHKSYSNTQCAEDYNDLLNQYYVLEEQRQKLLLQLYQFGSWDYQGSGSSVQWGGSTSQEHQVPAAQASSANAVCSCCPYVCPCLLAPCTSLPSCSSSGTCAGKTCAATSTTVHNGKSFPIDKGELTKTAMGAAERALSSLKIKASGISDVNKEKEGEVDTNLVQLAQNNSSETDLTVVLNAWYSAGFYTGKYLTEQSFAKK